MIEFHIVGLTGLDFTLSHEAIYYFVLVLLLIPRPKRLRPKRLSQIPPQKESKCLGCLKRKEEQVAAGSLENKKHYFNSEQNYKQ